MDWMEFFRSFFERHKDAISKILDADGCREGWLQGQMFLDAQDRGLRTNATDEKYDLYCESPPMIAEIKFFIARGHYYSKMDGLTKRDVDKLSRAPARFASFAKFMILLIDTREEETQLGRWLSDFTVESAEFVQIEPPGQPWLAKIWRMKEAPATPPANGASATAEG